MDDPNKLISWFLKNKSALNLELTSYSWGQNFHNKIFDYNSKIIFNNRIFEGRGTSYSEENALVKSLAECVERTVLVENNLKTSNGIAIHHDYKTACENAKNEAIERDSYLCHFLTSTPFKKTNFLDDKYGDIIALLLKNSIKLAFYKLSSKLETEVVVCICTGENSQRPFGLTFGMGCNKDIGSATEKSLFESVRNAFHFLDMTKSTKSVSLEQFKRKLIHTELDHLYLGYNTEYAKKVLSIFTDVNNLKSDAILEIENPDSIQTLTVPDFFTDLSLHAVKYTNSGLQDLYFGMNNMSNLNLTRLNSFDLNFKIESLINFPHFLG